ncbi:MAG: anti-anti-sigma factor [Candidatus Melainabacteria bacterium]|nr:MAG: anti-anti-sigma factor [Candidatus Melainabacteria bacterium]
MTRETAVPLHEMISGAKEEILTEWIKNQLSDKSRSKGVPEASLRNSSSEFIRLFEEAITKGNVDDIEKPEWEEMRHMLAELSATRASQGSTPSDTAKFIFSLKEPLFARLTPEKGQGNTEASAAVWQLSLLLDKLGLYTAETFQRTREAIIRRQQKEMLEMSTPVIKVWDGVVAVPLIGTLDSARTQIVMETLLQKIVDTGSRIAILDITGVPTVDTQTAQHLMKTVSATRLMGAECIISGIRPQIAQTIVHLGIDINDIVTKATMADAIKEALARGGWSFERHLESV